MTILFYAGRDDRVNFILISVDTLREDHIGSYGGKGVKTPHIDRLAGEGILFENVSSPIPTTSPSHASLLTSLYPRRHGVLRNGWKLSPDFVTLAEVFKGNGYKTAAFVSAFQVGSDFGFEQGFDYFDDDIKHGTRTAGEMLQVIFPWLEKNSEKPFFMWIHLFDPHVPLMPPEPFKSGYSGGDSRKALYRGEVAYTDSRLGMLWEALETLGITDNTCIIFTADHGHSMGEHGYWGHGGQLFEVTTRVPLIIKVPPGVAAEKSIIAQPSRIGTRLRIVDIYKTILDLAGIEIPNGLQGSSFLALMKQKGPRNGNDRDVFMETQFWEAGRISPFHKDAALIGPWKLIRYRNSPNELYNIVEDPAENNNVVENQPQIHDRLVETIEKWKKQNKPNQAALRYQEVDEETRKKLEAFGYFY